MRKIGDILIYDEHNEHRGKLCKIIDINRICGETKFTVQLIEKIFNWNTGKFDLTCTYSNVHYCSLKEIVDSQSK